MLRRSRAGEKHRWWAHQDLNLEPTDYESAALTVELWAHETQSSIFTGPQLILGTGARGRGPALLPRP
jgi:hypothetical protein